MVTRNGAATRHHQEESDGDARGRPCEAPHGSEDPDLDGCIGTTACADQHCRRPME